jgi:hypothetical protein
VGRDGRYEPVGKLLFQSLGLDFASTTFQFDISTPCVIEVN